MKFHHASSGSRDEIEMPRHQKNFYALFFHFNHGKSCKSKILRKILCFELLGKSLFKFIRELKFEINFRFLSKIQKIQKFRDYIPITSTYLSGSASSFFWFPYLFPSDFGLNWVDLESCILLVEIFSKAKDFPIYQEMCVFHWFSISNFKFF